jgi:hypothetical protein
MMRGMRTGVTAARSGRPGRVESIRCPRTLAEIPEAFRVASKPPGAANDAPRLRESFAAYRLRLEPGEVPGRYALPLERNETARWDGALWTATASR